MPVTFSTFAIGSYALAGLPLLAGFWSKDELLVSAYDGHVWLFVIMLVTAALTAFYTTRMVWLTFFGSYEGEGHPHESPATMTGPLIALATATVFIGFLGSSWFHAVFFKWVKFGEPEQVSFVWWIALLGSVAAIGGFVLGFLMYSERRAKDPLREPLGPLWTVFQNRYYIDAFYMRAIVYPIRDTVSAAVYWFNQNVLDALVNGAAQGTRAVSRLVSWFDRNVIDGFVNGVGESAGEAGGLLRYIQSGNVQWYAVGLFVGVIVLTIVFIKAA